MQPHAASALETREVQSAPSVAQESPAVVQERIEGLLREILLQVDRTLDVRSMTNAADQGAVIAVRFRGYSMLAFSRGHKKLLAIPEYTDHEFPPDVCEHLRQLLVHKVENVDEGRITWEGVTEEALQQLAAMGS